MKRINVIKENSTTQIIIGVIFILVSIILLIINIFLSSNINYILLFTQGLLFIAFAIYTTRYRKYYIEWDKDTIKYFFPKDKSPVLIYFADIEMIDIKLFEIHFKVKEEIKTIDLKHVDFEKIKQIKAKFEAIKTTQNLHTSSIITASSAQA